jgi:hypothetical protein
LLTNKSNTHRYGDDDQSAGVVLLVDSREGGAVQKNIDAICEQLKLNKAKVPRWRV